MADFDVEFEHQLAVPWVAVVVGVALVVVPSGVSEIMWPGWATTGVSTVADSGFAVWGALLGLSGLCLAAVGVWLGASAGFSLGAQIMLRMCGGAAAATFVSVGWLGRNGALHHALFLAPVFALAIAIPFWVIAGAGLLVGSLVHDP